MKSDIKFVLNMKVQTKQKKIGKRGLGLMKPVRLSPELAELMGSKSMPRQKVVKKMWSIIKERNLYDPENRQFAICDAQLEKIMKVKRFRAFGMMKLLQPHFLN